MLREIIAQLGSYNAAAETLGYTYPYVNQVANGYRPAGGPFYQIIKRLHRQIKSAKPRRKRISVSFPDEDEYQLVKTLTPQERRQVLLQAVKEKQQGAKPEWISCQTSPEN